MFMFMKIFWTQRSLRITENILNMNEKEITENLDGLGPLTYVTFFYTFSLILNLFKLNKK